MTINTRNTARLFALTFFAVLTLMAVDVALIAMYCRSMRELGHVKDLQADQRKDIGSLQADVAWARAAVQEMHDHAFHVKQTEVISGYCDGVTRNGVTCGRYEDPASKLYNCTPEQAKLFKCESIKKPEAKK